MWKQDFGGPRQRLPENESYSYLYKFLLLRAMYFFLTIIAVRLGYPLIDQTCDKKLAGKKKKKL